MVLSKAEIIASAGELRPKTIVITIIPLPKNQIILIIYLHNFKLTYVTLNS